VSKQEAKLITRVDSVWLVKIDEQTSLLVKKGDKVKQGEPIAKKSRDLFEKINASAVLSCQPIKISSFISFKKGDRVSKGDCLVSMTGFPFTKKRLLSPVSGIFYDFNNQSGEIRLVVDQKEEEIVSPVKGDVVEAQKDMLKIRFNACRILGRCVGKGKSWGKLLVCQKNQGFLDDVIDKLVFADELTVTDIEKATVLGSRGFLSFNFSSKFEKLNKPGLVFEKEVETIKSKLIELAGNSALLDSNTGQLLICID
jgi:hypothetical protein